MDTSNDPYVDSTLLGASLIAAIDIDPFTDASPPVVFDG
jgi:hypothetical protein